MKATAKFKDRPDFVPKIVYIRLDQIEANKGQLSKFDPVSGEQIGLPKNPRWIRDTRYKALKKSITDDPEYLNYNPLKVYSLKCVGRDGKYIVVDGNHRRQACIDLGFEEGDRQTQGVVDNLILYVGHTYTLQLHVSEVAIDRTALLR